MPPCVLKVIVRAGLTYFKIRDHILRYHLFMCFWLVINFLFLVRVGARGLVGIGVTGSVVQHWTRTFYSRRTFNAPTSKLIKGNGTMWEFKY